MQLRAQITSLNTDVLNPFLFKQFAKPLPGFAQSVSPSVVLCFAHRSQQRMFSWTFYRTSFLFQYCNILLKTAFYMQNHTIAVMALAKITFIFSKDCFKRGFNVESQTMIRSTPFQLYFCVKLVYTFNRLFYLRMHTVIKICKGVRSKSTFYVNVKGHDGDGL